MAAKAKKKRTGPIPKPASEKAQIRSTSIPPAVAAWLDRVGGGSVSRGMRTVLVREFERENAMNPSENDKSGIS